MGLVIDMAIALAALLAAAYCMVLSRRLRAFTRLDGDVGKAIAILSQQVDALSRALHQAEKTNAQASSALDAQIARADATARRLELMMAAHQGHATAPPVTDTAPVAPAPRADPAEPSAEFAPFGRAGMRNGEGRSKVLRQRDPARAAR
ncbi:hypothetical protein [Natronohydrobacter thiooxidans]|jgi:hypothetical protein|uniref:hypothetical protein n=1 Tax=Natronohydrobacter thiooxidans TaxID=87172 RepID=UPI0008FF68D7|nr:hypothetical protein [Natronohydrobacter thiooxidans]